MPREAAPAARVLGGDRAAQDAVEVNVDGIPGHRVRVADLQLSRVVGPREVDGVQNRVADTVANVYEAYRMACVGLFHHSVVALECLWRWRDAHTGACRTAYKTARGRAHQGPCRSAHPSSRATCGGRSVGASEAGAKSKGLTFLADAYAGKYKGKKVTMTGPFTDEDAVKFNNSMKEFKDKTGIDIQYEGSKEFEASISAQIQGGAPPDIIDFPSRACWRALPSRARSSRPPS